jgi:peptidyl-prolyl cis-trans isomerase B (cyclophilin B)
MKRLFGLALLLGLAGPAVRVEAAPPPARKRAVAALAPAVAEGPLEAVIDTAEGSFTIRLLADVAPRHVAHFAKTARAGGFDGTTFHRIVPRGIMQGGDPLSKDPAKKALYGTGGLGLLKAEFSPRPMVRGSVAAVLRPSSPDSAGNQFFVVLSDQPSLTGKFTIFGEVSSGMEVVDRIAETPVEGDKPVKRIVMQKVTIRPLAAPPSPSPSPAG